MASAPAEETVKGATALPPGVEAGWWAKVQENISREEYEVAWQGQTCWEDLPGAYQAPNRAQGFQTFFTDAGIRLVPQDEKATWQWGLSLVVWGRPGGLEPVAKASLHAEKKRIAADRPGISEWYINDERGLEHGFTIHHQPVASSQQPAVRENRGTDHDSRLPATGYTSTSPSRAHSTR